MRQSDQATGAANARPTLWPTGIIATDKLIHKKTTFTGVLANRSLNGVLPHGTVFGFRDCAV